MMTAEQVRKLLRERCEKIGSQTGFAIAHGLSFGHLSETLAGRRDPSPAILNALGLKKVVRYERRKG